MYKLILFDLGGVLFTDGTSIFMNKLALRYGVSKDQVKGVLDGEIGHLYRESKISRDEFWKKAIETLNLKEDADTLENEWIDSYEPIEETKEIIKKLSVKYKVYFLSNNVKEREEALEKRYNFQALFNGGVFSHKVGIKKPDPRIYQMVLDKAGIPAEESVFIDDHESSLVPAREMGITTILFETPDKLEKDLQNLGVL